VGFCVINFYAFSGAYCLLDLITGDFGGFDNFRKIGR